MADLLYHIHISYFRNARRAVIVLCSAICSQHGWKPTLPLSKWTEKQRSFNWKYNRENPCFGTTDCRVRHTCISRIQRSSNFPDLPNYANFSKIIQLWTLFWTFVNNSHEVIWYFVVSLRSRNWRRYMQHDERNFDPFFLNQFLFEVIKRSL